MWMAARRMARAQAVISPRVSPRMPHGGERRADLGGVGSPRRQAAKNSPASSSDRVAPSARRDSSGLKASDMASARQTAQRFTPARSRKLASSSWPHSVAMDSGWNCTPWIGRVLCCTPMISPSSVQAVTSRTCGRSPSAPTGEW
jgi:hypothetical protein